MNAWTCLNSPEVEWSFLSYLQLSSQEMQEMISHHIQRSYKYVVNLNDWIHFKWCQHYGHIMELFVFRNYLFLSTLDLPLFISAYNWVMNSGQNAEY